MGREEKRVEGEGEREGGREERRGGREFKGEEKNFSPIFFWEGWGRERKRRVPSVPPTLATSSSHLLSDIAPQ